MKYIDANKLKAEIERRITDNTFGAKLELIDILAWLDTLSEEPDKSLEEEVKNYFQGYWPETETVEQCNTDLHFTPPAVIRLARHFAEWGAEHLRDTTKKIDKSLEEAAEEYTQKMLESWRFDSTGCRPPRESFIAGAEWQKEQDMDEWIKDRDGCFWDGVNEGKKAMREQMLKDAVEADVMLTLHDKTGDISLHTGYLPKELGIKYGDKVSIVVLKAGEE